MAIIAGGALGSPDNPIKGQGWARGDLRVSAIYGEGVGN
eukprot:gene18117-45338_t